MRSPHRIHQFLRGIEHIWLLYPDMRFGQLLANVAGDADTWHWENSDWNRALADFTLKHPPVSPSRAEGAEE